MSKGKTSNEYYSSSELYEEIPKFIDKKTLLEFMASAEKSNESIANGKFFIVIINS